MKNEINDPVCEYSNLHLITYLVSVKKHKIFDKRQDAIDPRKSYAIFKKTDELLADVESYHNDDPVLFEPRSFEKMFKDLKFYLNRNSSAFELK